MVEVLVLMGEDSFVSISVALLLLMDEFWQMEIVRVRLMVVEERVTRTVSTHQETI